MGPVFFGGGLFGSGEFKKERGWWIMEVKALPKEIFIRVDGNRFECEFFEE